MNQLKQQFPDKPIKVVDIVAHGSSDSLNIKVLSEQHDLQYDKDQVGVNEFQDCAADATIILDACSTGSSEDSIARKIAMNNPGKKVFAPAVPLYFSKPIFTESNNEVEISNVVHGFAIFNGNTSKKFQFSE